MESFCLYFDYEPARKLVLELCASHYTNEQTRRAFEKISSRDLVEREFSVTLFHRRDMPKYKDLWQSHTDLYESRLLGIDDKSTSDDYEKSLAETHTPNINHLPSPQ